MTNDLAILILACAAWLNRAQDRRLRFLLVQNRVLRETAWTICTTHGDGRRRAAHRSRESARRCAGHRAPISRHRHKGLPERFFRSLKDECLNHRIPFGQDATDWLPVSPV